MSVAEELRRHQGELIEEISALAAPLHTGESPGFGKRAGDFTAAATEARERALAAQRLHAALGDVQRALAKLAEGSYGCCDRCARPIGGSRLAALPASVLCLDCKEREKGRTP